MFNSTLVKLTIVQPRSELCKSRKEKKNQSLAQVWQSYSTYIAQAFFEELRRKHLEAEISTLEIGAYFCLSYLMLNTKLHQRSWVSPRCTMANAPPLNPLLVLRMRDDRHRMPLLLQPEPQRDVRLHVAARADRQAHVVLRLESRERRRGQVDNLWHRSQALARDVPVHRPVDRVRERGKHAGRVPCGRARCGRRCCGRCG